MEVVTVRVSAPTLERLVGEEEKVTLTVGSAKVSFKFRPGLDLIVEQVLATDDLRDGRVSVRDETHLPVAHAAQYGQARFQECCKELLKPTSGDMFQCVPNQTGLQRYDGPDEASEEDMIVFVGLIPTDLPLSPPRRPFPRRLSIVDVRRPTVLTEDCWIHVMRFLDLIDISYLRGTCQWMKKLFSPHSVLSAAMSTTEVRLRFIPAYQKALKIELKESADALMSREWDPQDLPPFLPDHSAELLTTRVRFISIRTLGTAFVDAWGVEVNLLALHKQPLSIVVAQPAWPEKGTRLHVMLTAFQLASIFPMAKLLRQPELLQRQFF